MSRSHQPFSASFEIPNTAAKTKQNKTMKHVLLSFSELQIDKSSVPIMTDRQLEELRVKAMGDRLRIRVFCERKSQTAAEQKKRQDAIKNLKSML